MNIIFKNDTLFVDLERKEEIDEMKRRVCSITDGFKINNVVINTGGISKSNLKGLNDFMREYKENYNGSTTIQQK